MISKEFKKFHFSLLLCVENLIVLQTIFIDFFSQKRVHITSQRLYQSKETTWSFLPLETYRTYANTCKKALTLGDMIKMNYCMSRLKLVYLSTDAGSFLFHLLFVLPKAHFMSLTPVDMCI